jgi:hypothetical protein
MRHFKRHRPDRNRVMTSNRIIILLSLTMLVCSCSTVRLKSRNGLDIHLDAYSSDKLSGDYKNSKNDTINFRRTLYNNFNYDTLYRQIDLIVNITPIDKNKIKLKVFDSETAIDSMTIKGKYRKGYFKVRRQVNANFIAGPLLWVLAENTKYIGLTNNNNLVIMNSGGSGFLLLIALPIFAAGGGQTEIEYERQK